MHFVNRRHVIFANKKGEPPSNMTIARTIHPTELTVHSVLITNRLFARLGVILGGAVGLSVVLWGIDDSPLRWIFASIFTLTVALGLLQTAAHLTTLKQEFDQSNDLRHTSRHIDLMDFPRLYPLLLRRLAEEYDRALYPEEEPGRSEYVRSYGEGQGEQVFKLIVERANGRQVAMLRRFFRRADRMESRLRKSGKPYVTLVDYRADFMASRAAAQLVGALGIQPARKLTQRA